MIRTLLFIVVIVIACCQLGKINARLANLEKAVYAERAK